MDTDQQIKELKTEIKTLKEEIRLREKEHKADLAQMKARYRAGIRRRHQDPRGPKGK
jgi:hypothetical protein